MGWFLCRAAFDTRFDRVPDLARFAELRWLNRYDLVPPVACAAGRPLLLVVRSVAASPHGVRSSTGFRVAGTDAGSIGGGTGREDQMAENGMMRVAIGSDHAGFRLKALLADLLDFDDRRPVLIRAILPAKVESVGWLLPCRDMRL